MISFKKFEGRLVFFQDNKCYDLFKISDGFVIKENVDISGLGLKELPDLSKMICLGNFDCSNNDLTSLKGAPKEVRGIFNCCGNDITSLEYGPKKAEVYDCRGTFITNLRGAPETVSFFDCSFNPKLTSLEGGPKKADFYDCSTTVIKTLKGAPEEVKSFNCKYTKISSLIGGPKKAMTYYCPASLVSLEGAPKDCDNFGVYNASLGDKKLKNKENWDFIIARIKNGEIKVR